MVSMTQIHGQYTNQVLGQHRNRGHGLSIAGSSVQRNLKYKQQASKQALKTNKPVIAYRTRSNHSLQFQQIPARTKLVQFKSKSSVKGSNCATMYSPKTTGTKVFPKNVCTIVSTLGLVCSMPMVVQTSFLPSQTIPVWNYCIAHTQSQITVIIDSLTSEIED